MNDNLTGTEIREIWKSVQDLRNTIDEISIDIMLLKAAFKRSNREYTPTVGAWIRKMRHSLGMSQTKLGEKAHITQAEVSHFECGVAVPPAHVLDAICVAFGISRQDADEQIKAMKGEPT